MTRQRKELGQEGEAAAVRFLKKNGYRIVETNWQSRLGEIDVIAEKKGVLVFVEVKTRSGTGFGSPLDAVHPAKQAKLIQLAELFRVQKGVENRDCRFDVVGITGSPDEPDRWEIELVVDAFQV